ncbi:hypothetical protein ACFVMC_00230 [Nocardia sp. NPDC127579]|uniref:hypothetical protein n=1 Tax=Nocardia sp. NPDC127579 TaxID=3345402 RepID=UPI0036356370
MIYRAILGIVCLVTITGCNTSNPNDVGYSNHKIQELCDFSKSFYMSRFNAAELRVALSSPDQMSGEIAEGSSCSYYQPAGAGSAYETYLGNVLLGFGKPQSNDADNAESEKKLTVDGVVVTQEVEKIGNNQDPQKAGRTYVLSAYVDGWYGRMLFVRGDDEGTKAAAPLLVNMIQTLKGSVS